MDAGEAGAAGVREEAEEALVGLKVAGGIDQLHVPEGKAGLRGEAQGPVLPSRPGASPPLKAFPCCPGSYFHLLLLFLGVTCLDPDYLTGEIKGGPGNQGHKGDFLVMNGLFQ